MHPSRLAEEQLNKRPLDEGHVAVAQVYALLAIAEAIQDIGLEIKEGLRNLGSDIDAAAQR